MKLNHVPNLLFLFTIIFAMFPPAGIVSGQSTSPWNEVFNTDGTLRDDLTDLGEYSETVPWMNMEIPVLGNVLEASYHRYETPSGNVVVIPSATTLFFMTMNPSASGLLGSTGQVGNGAGVGIEAPGILKGLINSSPNLQEAWDTIINSLPNHVPPDQFFQDVISGKTNIFTIGGSNAMNFLWELLRISVNDHMLATTLLLYLKGQCASAPGGCPSIVDAAPQPSCPGATVKIGQPTLSIRPIAPEKSLVIGQDPNKRGADIQIDATIPPVVYTWYEAIPVYENRCRGAGSGETPNCKTDGSKESDDGVSYRAIVRYDCKKHVEVYEEPVKSVQAIANLSGESRDWIMGNLAERYYQATVHQPSFTLLPGLGMVATWCDGNKTCRANSTIERIPFADPGRFDLKMTVTTTGTPVSQPRILKGFGKIEVWITLLRSIEN